MRGDHAVITGGAGFVGSNLAERLLAEGYRVTVLDNFATGRPDNVAGLEGRDRFSIIEGDVRDPIGPFESVDYLYHLASRASPTDFESHPVDIATTNSLGTRNVLECARRHDATAVLASTSEVYGDPEVHPQPEEYNGNVNPRGPRAPYDESKRFTEALGVAYASEYDLDVRTARIFNTYGPRMRADDGRAIPTFVSQALRGQDLTVHGDGTQTRSFCYVTDLVAGLYRLATEPGMDGEVVNLGNTDEITIERLAETIRDLAGTDAEITYEPRPEDDPDLRRPDVSTASERLEWEPTVSLETGLERTIEGFRPAVAGKPRSTD